MTHLLLILFVSAVLLALAFAGVLTPTEAAGAWLVYLAGHGAGTTATARAR